MFAFISGIIAAIVFLVGGVIGLACFVFWIWMLFHTITNKGLDDFEKIVWVLVVFFLPFIGSIIYFFIGRPKAAYS